LCEICLPMSPKSAIPDAYYAIFAFYEPFLCILGFIGTFADPVTSHNQQAPWPANNPPPDSLPRATLVTIIQLAHVCSLVGVINNFIFTAARRHLHAQPALQEKIVGALMVPLLIGDLAHFYVTLWALGEQKWNMREWSPVLWATMLLGLSLLIPRIAWHLGIGRYVDKRDGRGTKS
jgi:hypothetical protein